MKRQILLAMLAATLAACSMGGTIIISEPSVPADIDTQLDRDGVLHLGDLSISIKPENFKGGLITAGPVIPVIPLGMGVDASVESGAFEIIVQFQAETQGFQFEPAKSELNINNRLIFPVSFAGPSEFSTWAREHHRSIPGHEWQCERRSLSYRDVTDRMELPPSKSCFFIKYEVETPDPSVEFSIKLNGVKKDGVSVLVPELRFKKGIRGVFFLLG